MNGCCHIIDEVYDVDCEAFWDWISNFSETSMAKFGVPAEKVKVEGEGVGCVRSFEWQGQPVEHRLLAKVDKTHFLSYEALKAAKPFDHTFVTTIQLDSMGENKTRFRWYVMLKSDNKELMNKALVGLHTHHKKSVEKWIDANKK